MNRTFFKINGQAPTGSHITMPDLARQIQPRAVVVMNSNELGFAIQAASPQTMIINRAHRTEEGSQWMQVLPNGKRNPNYRDPIAFANELLGTPPEHWIYLLNEPSAIDGNERSIRDMCGWIIRCAQHLIRNGRKVVLGNVGVGTFEYDDVFAGYYDDLIIFCSTNRESIVWGFHEYPAMFMPFGQGNMPDVMNPDVWHFDYAPRDIVNELLPDTWHIGRHHWFQHRAQHLDLPYFRVIITECGIDTLQDIQKAGLYQKMMNKYGTAKHPFRNHQFENIQGFYTMHHIYDAIFPSQSTAQVIYAQMQWAEMFYPDWVEGILYFMVGKDNDWDLKGFNFGHDVELMELMIQGAKDNMPEPIIEPNIPDEPVDPIWREMKAKAHPDNYVNIRSTPEVRRHNIVGSLEDWIPVLWYEDELHNRDWYRIHIMQVADLTDDTVDLILETDGVYVHRAFVEEREYAPPVGKPTVPVDITPIPPSTIMMTNKERSLVVDILNWISEFPFLSEKVSSWFKWIAIYASKVEVEE